MPQVVREEVVAAKDDKLPAVSSPTSTSDTPAVSESKATPVETADAVNGEVIPSTAQKPEPKPGKTGEAESEDEDPELTR